MQEINEQENLRECRTVGKITVKNKGCIFGVTFEVIGNNKKLYESGFYSTGSLTCDLSTLNIAEGTIVWPVVSFHHINLPPDTLVGEKVTYKKDAKAAVYNAKCPFFGQNKLELEKDNCCCQEETNKVNIH